MPSRYEAQNAETFAQDLERAFIIVQADGWVNECYDEGDLVHASIVYDESGYGPHTASLFVDQNRYHASSDTVLQGAYEMHEEWMREHYGDHLTELMEERLAEHVKDYLNSNPGASNEDAIEAVQDEAYQEADEWFRETMNGFFYEMSASEFVAVLDSSTSKYVEEVRKGVNITRREECEEPEEVEDPGYNVVDPGHPRTSGTRRRGAGGLLAEKEAYARELGRLYANVMYSAEETPAPTNEPIPLEADDAFRRRFNQDGMGSVHADAWREGFYAEWERLTRSPVTARDRVGTRRRQVQPYQRREPKPQGFRYSITYEVVTEESAAEGDAEERGYEVEDVQVDTLQDLAHEVDSYGWIEDSGRWFDTEPQQDMHSGSYTRYSLHVKHLDGTELSSSEYRKLKGLLGVR